MGNEIKLRVFQEVVFPQPNSYIPEKLYLKSKVGDVKTHKNHLCLTKGARVDFGSFYNSLSVAMWQINCSLENVILSIVGTGRIRLALLYYSIGSTTQELLFREIKLDKEPIYVEIPNWVNITEGTIYFTLEALSDSTIEKVNWVTSTAARRIVKLGIVITHFNRKDYVLPALKRLNEELLSDKEFSDIAVCVVDNSQNISPDEVGQCLLVPNINTGGTGGFMRGLICLKDLSFTHCVFMDDDADCDIESIRRVFHVYQFLVSDSKFALAGVMIQENNPYYSYEIGGVFSYRSCRRNKFDLNLLSSLDLCRIERSPYANYGAWCFFAFPVDSVEKFPIPLFVRGDDILFSLLNGFKVRSIAGIATFIDSFELKESPLTRYLSFRGDLFDKLLIFDVGFLDVAIPFARQYVAALLSYKYETAEAIDIALKDVFLTGVSVLTEDKTGAKLRSRIGEINKLERITQENAPNVELPSNFNESIFRKFFRLVTINGSLTPFFLKDKVVLQPLRPRATFRQVFQYKNIYYYNSVSNAGYVASFSSSRFWSGLVTLTKTLFLIALKLSAVKAKIKSESSQVITEEFWRNYLNVSEN